jgi:ABC-type bacteriocin/lantibiotic exporter with double-glycine peptidase domain
MEESAEAVRGRKNTRASTIWKIVAAVVTILFVMLLMWVGSRLVWFGAG